MCYLFILFVCLYHFYCAYYLLSKTSFSYHFFVCAWGWAGIIRFGDSSRCMQRRRHLKFDMRAKCNVDSGLWTLRPVRSRHGKKIQFRNFGRWVWPEIWIPRWDLEMKTWELSQQHLRLNLVCKSNRINTSYEPELYQTASAALYCNKRNVVILRGGRSIQEYTSWRWWGKARFKWTHRPY